MPAVTAEPLRVEISVEQVVKAAVALPFRERQRLIDRLKVSLADEVAAIPPPPSTEPRPTAAEFIADLERKDADLRSGKTKGHTHEEVMAAARRAIGCE